MIYDNMLPEIKMIVPRKDVVNLDALVTLARDAEKLVHERDNYKPLTPPERSLLPHVAYKEKAPAGTQTKATTVHAVAVPAEPAPSQLSTQVGTIVREALAELGLTKTPELPPPPSPKALTAGNGRNNKNWKRNKPASTSSVTIEEVTDERGKKSPRTPASDHNKDQKERGPNNPHIKCWGCSWPQHTLYTCPECSQKSGKGQGKK